ncbi:hypothetical protein [Tetragenococcus muriaticus]|uniref:hypothetical protein n=1 Tax=Tetragenococcus muriaticus TaxID=64642 RepID=UPI00138AE9D7|nr:hypothetical protein [Tetragenococcus muriaticus]
MKKQYLKLGLFFLVAFILVIQLSGCDQSKKYKGYWSGLDEYGDSVDLEINNNTLKFLQDDQLTEYDYKIKETTGVEEENKDEVYGDMLVVNDIDTRIILAENKVRDDGTLTMGFSLDGGNSLTTVDSLVKQDKNTSPIADSEKDIRDAKDTQKILFLIAIVAVTATIFYRKKVKQKNS